ncbi:MAG: hypothetical protein F4X02_04720 [Chloroflexi bacterium]|nr:hypothetical protein [Chloroflexota bacterium]
MPLRLVMPRWLDWLWPGLLAIYIVAGAAIAPFHGDESTLIWMGRDYFHINAESGFSRVLYDGSPLSSDIEQLHRLINGTVSKTIYGWAASTLDFEIGDLNNLWNWSRDFRANVADNHFPDAALLLRSRQLSALQLALAGATFFAFARVALNRPTAYLASLTFALHPTISINGRRAMMEGSHLLGLTLVLLAAAWLMQDRKPWKYLALGICAGFALAAKHHNVVAVTALYLALALPPMRHWLRSRKWRRQSRELLLLIASGFAAIGIFLLLNPGWWSAPLQLAFAVIEEREALMTNHVIAAGGYDSFGAQIIGFFRYVFVGARQYFELAHWAGYAEISEQIMAYEASGLAGVLLIGNSTKLGILCLVASAIGAGLLARNRGVSADMRLLILLWAGISALATLQLTPLPWARYYLPLLPVVILLAAYGATSLAEYLLNIRVAKADGHAVLD